MNISVIGLGYVGLTNALFLSQFHKVYGWDTDYNKIDELSAGQTYLGEPHLQKLLTKHLPNLHFFHDPQTSLAKATSIIIAVPTPEGAEGQTDLTAIFDSVNTVCQFAKKQCVLIIRSTIPPGTYEKIMRQLNDHSRNDIQVVVMPEFLSLGQAWSDTLKPKRMVVGTNSTSVFKIIQKIYPYPPGIPFLQMSPQTAILTKYAANGFLATKVSFINEMSQLAEATGADIQDVITGLSFDPRIGQSFLQPGVGFGGSCFPKDLKALRYIATHHHVQDTLLQATLDTNTNQMTRFANRILAHFNGNIKGRKIAVLGLSYKGSTQDVRNSPAFHIIDALTDQEAIIFAYDQKATFDFFNLRGEKPCLAYATQLEDALKDAEVAVVLNDAKEIAALTAKDFVRWMKTPVVFDGRNLYSPQKMKGVTYHSVGRLTSL